MISDPNNPGTNTVDEFFEFNLGGESFADVFGDVDTAGPVDPYEICAALDLPYPTHTYEDDSVVGDTVSNPTGSCEVGQWVTPADPNACTALDGNSYPQGSWQCDACLVGGVLYPETNSECIGGGGICYDENGASYPEGSCQCTNTPPCDNDCQFGDIVPSGMCCVDGQLEPCDMEQFE